MKKRALTTGANVVMRGLWGSKRNKMKITRQRLKEIIKEEITKYERDALMMDDEDGNMYATLVT